MGPSRRWEKWCIIWWLTCNIRTIHETVRYMKWREHVYANVNDIATLAECSYSTTSHTLYYSILFFLRRNKNLQIKLQLTNLRICQLLIYFLVNLKIGGLKIPKWHYFSRDALNFLYFYEDSSWSLFQVSDFFFNGRFWNSKLHSCCNIVKRFKNFKVNCIIHWETFR